MHSDVNEEIKASKIYNECRLILFGLGRTVDVSGMIGDKILIHVLF